MYSLEDLLASFVSIMPEFCVASNILRCWRAVDVLESQAVSSSSSVTMSFHIDKFQHTQGTTKTTSVSRVVVDQPVTTPSIKEIKQILKGSVLTS